MPALFVLDVTTDTAARRATLRLQDDAGRHLGAHEVALDQHAPSLWSGLFDTRRHVARMRDVEAPEAQLAKLGRFLGEHVLGGGIAGALAAGVGQRTVLVRLPDPTGDNLAAAFARVPWEIARAPGDALTLLDRNVVVRAAPAGATPGRETALALEPGKPVRVLLVFTEGPGSRPLAARLERERLLDLFFEEVLPERHVEVEVLCHGVTRRRIREQVRARGGYHVVHWSGRGNAEALEIALDEGEKAEPQVSGKDLVRLFSGAGGFIPWVMFLSACHSALGAIIEERVGFTGTALALVQSGVKQVVTTRYEVGDRYARRLARRFYRRLLADQEHHAVDAALALARTELARDKARAGEYDAVDHAGPLVIGSDLVRIEPAEKRSPQMDRRAPKPQPLLPNGSKELDPPHGFVGRVNELTTLAREWLAPSGVPIALVQGLGGMGKTSLAAEAIHLWFDRFDYVLCFQSKGGALSIEDFYRRLDQQLILESKSYRERCREAETARAYLELQPSLAGADREEAQWDNLIDILGSEQILLVLDNFETNLLTQGGPEYVSQDPAWDRLFEALGDRLRGSGSRVLVTSRHKLAALASPRHGVWIPLGPLLMAEARLFFEGQRPIRELLFGDDEAKRLARRILDVSRGHPLVLARLADLTRAYHDKSYGLTPAGRTALTEALDKIQGRGYQTLPEVFVGAKTDKERADERRYLEDVTIGAVDLLIGRLSGDARRLLWVVTRAGEPTMENMIAGAWGEPASMLLGELCGSGLLVRDSDVYAFHDLVAERAAAWMESRPDERAGRTEAEVWTLYGTLYGAAFKALLAAAKRDQASEAGRRGIRYLVRARAFDHLRDFAGQVVTGTHDPALLGQVVVDLRRAVGEVPGGEARWSLRTYLADALWRSGRADQALSLYAQAAEEAEAAERWSELGAIYGNWANAFGNVGQLDRARETHLKSAEAERRAGNPRIVIVGSELEALRVDVMQGRAEDALPAIQAKLGEVRAWWALRQQGKPVPEAPDDEDLARTLVGALDVAYHTNLALERWQPGLDLLGDLEQVERVIGTGEHEVARTRFNRYGPLMRLGKLAEAKAVLEDCLDVFRQVKDVMAEVAALAALADVWDELGDPTQAIALERQALGVRERLPDPGDRADSHNNLANYLHVAGATGEAKAHLLAALVYGFAAGLDRRVPLHNLAHRIRQSAARNETFTFPALSDLLALPAFAPLRALLADRAVPLADLQTAIDDLVAQARAAIAAPATPHLPLSLDALPAAKKRSES